MIGLMTILATATTPTPLAPSTKWFIDYQPDMCIASRSFGPVGSSIALALKPPVAMGAEGQQLYILTQPTGGGGMSGQASMTLLPSGQRTTPDFESWPTLNNKARAYEMHVDASFMASMAEATGISLTLGEDTYLLATGKMRPVLDALKTCNDKLFRSWGVDPAAMAIPPPGVSPASWFPQNSYPAAAKRRGAQGRTVIVLTVSSDGAPTACRVVIKAEADLDEATCRLATRRGRFEKSSGTADRYAVLAVRWSLGR